MSAGSAVVSAPAIKRRVLQEAAKMSAVQINDKIDALLFMYEASLDSSPEREIELKCWADLWLRRKKE